MDQRRSIFNLRTTKMSNDMYEHIEKRIREMPQKSFREYAFRLIEQDMADDEKKRRVYDEIRELRKQVQHGFQQLNQKIDHNTLHPPSTPGHSKKDNVTEGQLVTEEVTGSVDEEYNMDF